MLGLTESRFKVRACGNGLNGPRLHAWARVATASPEHFLVILRALDDNGSDPATGGGGDEQGAGDGTTVRDPRTEDREIASQNWFHVLSCAGGFFD